MTEEIKERYGTIDKEVIDKLAAGDYKAFRAVFRSMYPRVKAFANGFLKNGDDAEDIAQAVFIRLWTKRDKVADVSNIDTFLYVMTKRLALNYLAVNRPFMVDISEIKGASARTVSAQEQMEADDLRLLIDMVVSNMPKQRQAVYRMSREQGMSNDEIAAKLGLQKKTVENHLNSALNDIRSAMLILLLLFFNWV